MQKSTKQTSLQRTFLLETIRKACEVLCPVSVQNSPEKYENELKNSPIQNSQKNSPN